MLHFSVSCQPVTVKLAATLMTGRVSLGHSECMIKMLMALSFLTIRNLTRSPSSQQCENPPCSCGYNDAAGEQMFSTSDTPCADVLLGIAWVDYCDFLFQRQFGSKQDVIQDYFRLCLTAHHKGKEERDIFLS